MPPPGQGEATHLAPEALRQGFADALQALHKGGILHRDLKPSNLVWSGEGRAVLIDFGLALVDQHHSASLTGRIVGTSAYMSPEQGRGQEVDQRADIYSLAATLWHLLTGHPPLGMPQRGILFGSGLPMDPRLLRILQTALEPNRRYRFPSAGQFASALTGWLRDEDHAFASGSSASIRRWLYFRRFELALGTSVVAVGVAILLGLYLFRRVEATPLGLLLGGLGVVIFGWVQAAEDFGEIGEALLFAVVAVGLGIVLAAGYRFLGLVRPTGGNGGDT